MRAAKNAITDDSTTICRSENCLTSKALLVKQFSDRQIVVESSVIAFLAARIERSFAAVKQTVSDIDQLSLRKQSPITIPLAREVLQR